MTGSPPNGAAAEHCTVGASATLIVLSVTYRYVAAAAPVTRREAEDWSDDGDDENTFGVDADALALGLLLEICLTRFTCCFARDISAVVEAAVERGCSARRRAEDKNIMVMVE